MRYDQVLKSYRVGLRHNPKHFYANSFQIERQERRLVLVAVVKRHVGKRFRIVGVLKQLDS